MTGSERRRREEEHAAGLRWLILGDIGLDDSDDDDAPLGLCMEIEGLFVDLPPRPREHFTLVGCAPDGALGEALGTDQTWLGDVVITAPEPPGLSIVVLGDVVVLGQRPSTVAPGTVDVDLSGFVHVYDRTDAVRRPRDEVTEFALAGQDDARYGTCVDVTGVFRDQGAPLVPQIRLLGCRPEPALLTALEAIGQPIEADRRRWVRATAHTVAADGSTAPILDSRVVGRVQAGEPSRLGAGLLDITIDNVPGEPLSTGVLDILGHWHTGRPVEKNLWAGYDRELRYQWARIAVGRRPDGPDRPAGITYELDGRFVTDIEGFYCAIGEAINGPGGYFGSDLDGFDDCLCGGFGAQTPFRLVWHDSAVAREHLVDGYDRRRLAPAASLNFLLDLMTKRRVEIDLR